MNGYNPYLTNGYNPYIFHQPIPFRNHCCCHHNGGNNNHAVFFERDIIERHNGNHDLYAERDIYFSGGNGHHCNGYNDDILFLEHTVFDSLNHIPHYY